MVNAHEPHIYFLLKIKWSDDCVRPKHNYSIRIFINLEREQEEIIFVKLITKWLGLCFSVWSGGSVYFVYLVFVYELVLTVLQAEEADDDDIYNVLSTLKRLTAFHK